MTAGLKCKCGRPAEVVEWSHYDAERDRRVKNSLGIDYYCALIRCTRRLPTDFRDALQTGGACWEGPVCCSRVSQKAARAAARKAWRKLMGGSP